MKSETRENSFWDESWLHGRLGSFGDDIAETVPLFKRDKCDFYIPAEDVESAEEHALYLVEEYQHR